LLTTTPSRRSTLRSSSSISCSRHPRAFTSRQPPTFDRLHSSKHNPRGMRDTPRVVFVNVTRTPEEV
jgi:hypothetical protein